MADPADARPPLPWRGILTVVALLLFGALFLALLSRMTRGRMHPPPPETRTERR